MPKATWIQTNFNAGEWSPLAWGRVDLAKYKNGLAECINFMPTQQGGLTRRPGSRYVAAVKDSTYAPRLVRFEFSTTQAYILEFGHQYIRFYTNDGQLLSSGTPYEVATPYSSTDVWSLNFAQSADTLYIAHPSYAPRKLQRAAATSWSLSTITFLDGPYLGVNTTGTTMVPSGTSGTVTVTASSTTGINGGAGFRASDVGRMLRMKCGGVWLWGVITEVTNTTHVKWSVNNGVSAAPITATASANLVGGSVASCTITEGGRGYGVAPPTVSIGAVTSDVCTAQVTSVGGTGDITGLTITHAGSGYGAAQVVGLRYATTGPGVNAAAYLETSGGVPTSLSLIAGHGGTGYSVGDVLQVIAAGSVTTQATAYASLTDGVVTSITIASGGAGYGTTPVVTISAPTAVIPNTTTFWRLGVWNATDGYPSAVTFHQDRIWWAGAAGYPGRLDASASGDYENMAPSNSDGQVLDNNAMSFSLNAGSVNSIRWLMSDEWGLMAGTAGGEWMISPSTQQQAITPTNVNAKQLSNYGSSSCQPIRVGKAALFVQRTGRKLRELWYQFTANTFQAQDISLVAEHLTKSGIKQMALQPSPQQLVWMVTNAGALVGITYDRDQEICGWHQHVMGGFSDAAQTLPPLVESVASIPAPSIQRDELWVVVKRYINGSTIRTVEVLAKAWESGDTSSSAVFVDSSAEYSGTATTTISGLTWLKGQTVGVLTNGAVHPDCTVSNSGAITLSRSATVVQVGLKYASSARTMFMEAGGADGPAQGKRKRVHRAIVRFFESIGISMGSDESGGSSYPQPFRTSADRMDGPVSLFDGIKVWAYEGNWDTEGQVFFSTSDPLPCNITQLVAQLETQDNL